MMAILINYKICDNAAECGAFEVCPTGAIYWDASAGRIRIDNEKCVSCGACAGACPIGAIMVARSKAEYEAEEKKIAADKRRREDLFVDRYGARPFSDEPLTAAQAPEYAATSHGDFCLGLLPAAEDMPCLINSIPIKGLVPCAYRAVEDGAALAQSLGVSELPALVFFRNGKRIGAVEGYYAPDESERALLAKRIKEILG